MQFELDGYDGLIGSHTLAVWEPFTKNKDYFEFKGAFVPWLTQVKCSTTKETELFQKKWPNNRFWFTIKTDLIQSQFHEIHKMFNEKLFSKDLTKLKRNLECSAPQNRCQW